MPDQRLSRYWSQILWVFNCSILPLDRGITRTNDGTPHPIPQPKVIKPCFLVDRSDETVVPYELPERPRVVSRVLGIDVARLV